MRIELFIEHLDFIRSFDKVYVACSGGSDSLALLHQARMLNLNPIIAYFDHEDNFEEIEFVTNHAKRYKFEMIIGSSDQLKKDLKNSSEKAVYRNHRMAFLSSLDGIVLLGHTLDDVIETMIFSTLKYGECRIIPFSHANCIRPILSSKKNQCIKFLQDRKIQWYEDVSNSSYKYDRNFIRHEIVPLAYQVNPGIDKVAWKKVKLKIEEFEKCRLEMKTSFLNGSPEPEKVDSTETNIKIAADVSMFQPE